MSEPTAKRERRPEGIPADWCTRQKAQIDLRLRSPYALAKLLAALQPTAAEFQVVGQTGYLSPGLVERMKLELAEVEDIRDLPGYLSGMAAQAVIGCSFQKFGDLVIEHRPSVQQREVVKARNNNSEANPVYSPAYVDSLIKLYEPIQRKGISSRSSAPAESAAGHGVQPSHALVDRVLHRIDTASVSNLVDPSRIERDQLAVRVSAALNQLGRIPARASDPRLAQLWGQLNQALSELKGDRPMPQGVERLLEQAARYLRVDED